jgi:hypothetical protein
MNLMTDINSRNPHGLENPF